jgi:hypothetical protein
VKPCVDGTVIDGELADGLLNPRVGELIAAVAGWQACTKISSRQAASHTHNRGKAGFLN